MAVSKLRLIFWSICVLGEVVCAYLYMHGCMHGWGIQDQKTNITEFLLVSGIVHGALHMMYFILMLFQKHSLRKVCQRQGSLTQMSILPLQCYVCFSFTSALPEQVKEDTYLYSLPMPSLQGLMNNFRREGKYVLNCKELNSEVARRRNLLTSGYGSIE